MKILFIHPNFPGQFKHLAAYFGKDPKNKVMFACRYPHEIEIKGVEKVVYRPKQDTHNEKTHNYLHQFEVATYAGQAMWHVCDYLKKKEFVPDVIVAHPGWGEGMFLKDVFPDVPYIAYMEFFYHAFGADMHFHPDEPTNPDRVCRTRIRNATHLTNAYSCDWAISPTQWQAHVHPHEFHHKFSVIHEGIDTDKIKPLDKERTLTLSGGTKLTPETETITYVARNFEPYRGFPSAMQAVEILMKRRPKAHFLMVGADDVSYGAKLQKGTYREYMLKKVKLDEDRIHWLGKLPYEQYLRVLQQSQAHIYLTVPFVLSWSFLEAMALGCPIVSSKVPPIQEVAENQKNALLADFFSPEDIAEKVEYLLDNPEEAKRLGNAARKTIVDNYALKDILPKYVKLITDVAKGKIPPTDAKALAPKPFPYGETLR